MAHYSTTAVASSGMLSSSVSVAPPPPLRLTRAAYDDTEIHSLCDAVDQIRPRSHGAWMLVAQLHAQTYPDRNRHAESLNRQWAKTCRRCRTAAASPDALVERPSYLQRVLDIQRRLKATTKKNYHQQPLFVVSNNTIVTNNNHAVTATIATTGTGINHASLNVNAPANNSNSGVNNYHQAPAENNDNEIALVQQQHPQQQQQPPYAYANEDEDEDEEEDDDEVIDDDDDDDIEDEVFEAGEDVQANIQLNDNNSIEIRIRREERHRYNILLQQEMDRHDEELNRLTTKTVETIMNLYVKSMELFAVALAHGRR